MSQFMILLHERDTAPRPPAETKARLDARASFEAGLRRAAAHRDGERLRPISEGLRVSSANGVTQAPANGCALAGYWVVEEASLEAAVELARACPVEPGDEVEVRPVMKGTLSPSRSDERGRIFAFAVLGRASDERAWTDVMDRIDDSAGDRFPPGRFLGGVRLEAPSRGASLGGRRAVFDGPFIEGKEIIGGLFFMRMAGAGDAAEWALGTAFARLGALEIRELWRS